MIVRLLVCLVLVLSVSGGCQQKSESTGEPIRVAATIQEKPADLKPALAYEQRIKAFKTAVEKGRISEFKELLKAGADINDKDEEGQTALMWAAAKGHRSMVWLLLSQGGMIGERDHQGRNALMHAIEGDSPEIAWILMSPSSAANTAGDLLKTIGVNTKVTQPGATIEETDKKGETVLIKAARHGSQAMVKLLLDYPARASVTPVDKQGKTALMHAAGGGHKEVVEQLLATFNKVKPGLQYVALKDRTGKTAAQLAAAGGHKEVAAFLEVYAKDPESRDEKGQTAIVQALLANDQKAFDALLARGVDLRVKDAEDRTLFSLAVQKGQVAMLASLWQQLGLSYLKGQEVLNVVDKQGRTALMHAAMLNQAMCVEALLGKGERTYNRPGLTEFILALTVISDKEGKNPLMLAAERGHDAVVTALLRAYGDQADYDLPGAAKRLELLARKDKAGKTALQLAQEANHAQVVELLKKYGAK